MWQRLTTGGQQWRFKQKIHCYQYRSKMMQVRTHGHSELVRYFYLLQYFTSCKRRLFHHLLIVAFVEIVNRRTSTTVII